MKTKFKHIKFWDWYGSVYFVSIIIVVSIYLLSIKFHFNISEIIENILNNFL